MTIVAALCVGRSVSIGGADWACAGRQGITATQRGSATSWSLITDLLKINLPCWYTVKDSLPAWDDPVGRGPAATTKTCHAVIRQVFDAQYAANTCLCGEFWA